MTGRYPESIGISVVKNEICIRNTLYDYLSQV